MFHVSYSNSSVEKHPKKMILRVTQIVAAFCFWNEAVKGSKEGSTIALSR